MFSPLVVCETVKTVVYGQQTDALMLGRLVRVLAIGQVTKTSQKSQALVSIQNIFTIHVSLLDSKHILDGIETIACVRNLWYSSVFQDRKLVPCTNRDRLSYET